MSTEIEPISALSLIVTIFLAISITMIFQKKREINISLNSIINKRIEKVVERIEYIQDQIISENLQSNTAFSFSKRTNGSLKCIWKIVDNHKIKIPIKFSNLRDISREIGRLLTDTPAADTEAAKHPELEIVNHKMKYSDNRRAQIALHFEKLNDQLFQSQVEINQASR